MMMMMLRWSTTAAELSPSSGEPALGRMRTSVGWAATPPGQKAAAVRIPTKTRTS